MDLPNLDGQPPWVVIVVFALFVLGTLGGVALRHRGKGDPEDEQQIADAPDTVSLAAGSSPYDYVRDAMGVLATQAAESAKSEERAEQEAKEARDQLAECAKQLAVLTVRHEQLQKNYEECLQRWQR